MPSQRTRDELDSARRMLAQLERRAEQEDRALATSGTHHRRLAVELHRRFCTLGARCTWQRAPEPDSPEGPSWGEGEHQTYLLHGAQLVEVLRGAGYMVTEPAAPAPSATPAVPAPLATAVPATPAVPPAPAPISAPGSAAAAATMPAAAPAAAAPAAAAPTPAPGGAGGGQAGT